MRSVELTDCHSEFQTFGSANEEAHVPRLVLSCATVKLELINEHRPDSYGFTCTLTG